VPLLSDNLTIARLGPADAAQLGEFFVELAEDAETQRFFRPHPLTAAYAAALCTRLGYVRDQYHALWDDGRIVGYAMVRGWDEGFEVPSFGVAVAASHRGMGLGQRFLEHAIKECRRLGAPKLRLTVFKRNENAVHIYRKFGFDFKDKNADELVGLLDLKR
jgi:ribosomal-protein-alanine N-acetyltransferase